MYDCAIIGTGPAGLSAAINLKLHNKNFIWFGKKEMSAKTVLAEKVVNYPGLPMISGEKLSESFRKHAESMGLEITDRMVSLIAPSKTGFMILADNDMYEARTLILAIGVVGSKEYPGEKELVGRGVSYCATCDGFLYKGKSIAVVCTDKHFEHEIRYLAEIAGSVQLFPLYKNCEINPENTANVTIVNLGIERVNGSPKFSGLTLKDGTELYADGLFCLRSAIAPSTLLPQLKTENGAVPVDRAMATNVPGCFACGDCTGAPYQFAKAVGEGNVAAHSVIAYLAE